MKTFLFTGGGTAGHVIPAKPIMQELLNRGDAVVFVGSNSGLEERLVEDLGVRFESIVTGKLRRYFSFQNLIDMFRVPIGVLQSLILVGRIRPIAVFSKGGYVAFPVVFASWLLRIPVVAHESDLSPGLATRLCSPFVKSQCLNFDTTPTSASHSIVTGTPIRRDLLKGDAERAREWLGLSGEHKPVLVVVGGSLGAEEVNVVVRGCAEKLTENYTVVHVCGSGNVDVATVDIDGYFQFEYVNEQWGDVLALADVVVSRSGANSLFELLTLRKPNILVPLPLATSRGDQIENAEYAEARGWSLVVPQEKLNHESLVAALELVSADLDSRRRKMQDFPIRDSLSLIVSELDRVAK